MSHWTILCDFDGTISVEDITDALLERFARPAWVDIEQAWKRGEIGSRQCMEQQVALIDADRDELDACLDGMRIDPAFAAFVAATRAAGVPLTVLSDGLDHSIRRILARHGLGGLPIVANHLVATGPRGWRLEFPWRADDCRSGNCKCTCARQVHAQGRRVLLIGDGASDFCVAGAVDLVFAKHRLVEHCRAAAIAHVPISGFADALELLPALLAGELVAPAVGEACAATARVA